MAMLMMTMVSGCAVACLWKSEGNSVDSVLSPLLYGLLELNSGH